MGVLRTDQSAEASCTLQEPGPRPEGDVSAPWACPTRPLSGPRTRQFISTSGFLSSLCSRCLERSSLPLHRGSPPPSGLRMKTPRPLREAGHEDRPLREAVLDQLSDQQSKVEASGIIRSAPFPEDLLVDFFATLVLHPFQHLHLLSCGFVDSPTRGCFPSTSMVGLAVKLALDMHVDGSESAPLLSCERHSGVLFALYPSSIPMGQTCPR